MYTVYIFPCSITGYLLYIHDVSDLVYRCWRCLTCPGDSKNLEVSEEIERTEDNIKNPHQNHCTVCTVFIKLTITSLIDYQCRDGNSR